MAVFHNGPTDIVKNKRELEKQFPMPDSIISQKEDRDTFGGRLCRAREAANMSITDLARNVGVMRKTMEAWETDAMEPRSNRIANLAGVLGVSPTWLLQGIGAAPRGEVEADELRILKAQVEQMEKVALELTRSIDQLKKSLSALASARD